MARTLGVLVLFLFSVLCVTWSLRAQASAEPRVISTSGSYEPPSASLSRGHKDGGEESEEDFAPTIPVRLYSTP